MNNWNAMNNNLNNFNSIFNMNNMNNFNSMNNINNFNNFNSINSSIQNFQESSNNNYKTAVFKYSGYLSKYCNFVIMIKYKDEDLISTLIDKFIKKYERKLIKENIKFIFNAKKLNENLTAKEAGLTQYANIFVSYNRNYNIIFKFLEIKNAECPFLIPFIFEKISDLMYLFISLTGLNSSDILNLYYKNKKLNEGLSIEEAGLMNNSEIFVKLKIH